MGVGGGGGGGHASWVVDIPGPATLSIKLSSGIKTLAFAEMRVSIIKQISYPLTAE